MYKVGGEVTEVGIDYSCVDCGKVLGQVRMRSDVLSDRAITVLELSDGSLPFEGTWKALVLECDRCNRTKRISETNVAKELDVIWEQDSRRVETKKV